MLSYGLFEKNGVRKRFSYDYTIWSFPGDPSIKECRRHKRHLCDPWVRKIPWSRTWQFTPVFLSGESHGQRSPEGYSPWGHKELFQMVKHLNGKTSHLQCGRPRFNPWVRKIPWRRKWQPTPVLLSGKFHGWRSLVGYSPWGRKELDMAEQLH